jgi:hypothetical protein
MKQKKTITICMFALCFFLFIYSQDYADEIDVDVWISEHQTEIRIMKREDWLKLDETLKRPVYRKFTEKQCYYFWIDKVNEVMRSFDWNELEKIHLNLLLNTLSDNRKWFENDKIESLKKIDKEAFETFFSAWTEYAKDTLGWNSHLIGAILVTGNKVLNKKGDVETKD